jgi:hypothetical protein
MKKHTIATLFLFIIALSGGCAHQKATVPEELTIQTNPNRSTVTENIHRKLELLDAKGLLSVSNFIDKIWETKATSGEKEVLVLTVDQKGFPPLLEEVLARHERLNTLPRDIKTLFVLESKKVPGVKNIFIEVPAELIKDGDTVFTWMPNEAEVKKFVDTDANRLAGRNAQETFLTLFTMGNMEWNPELIKSVEKKKWNWEKMIHPKKTKTKRMFIPIGTLTPALKEFF